MMSIYLRSSVSVGPFRCGISRSGLTVSTGLPGLRIGAGPRGTFVRVGDAGVHSYLTMPTSGPSPHPRLPDAPAVRGSDGIGLHDITGVGVAELLPARPGDMIESLNAAARRLPLWPWVLALVVVLAVAASPLTLLVGVPAVVIAALWDCPRRTVVALYEVDGQPAARYAKSVEDFAAVIGSRAAWHRLAQGALRTTHQKKVNAGASSLVQRQSLARSLAGPPHLASNIAIPTLRSAGRSIYLLPDRALVQVGTRYAAVLYDDLRVHAGSDRFIEDGPVPADATVIGSTWRYVNKNGGPDRRFSNNRRLPVVQYGEVVLTTASGMSTTLSFSSFDAAEVLATAITRLRLPSLDSPAASPGPVPVPAPGEVEAMPQVRSAVAAGHRRSGRHRSPVVDNPTNTGWASPSFPADAELVALSEDGRQRVVGESHYQTVLAGAAGGRAAGDDFADHLPARAVLVPEPSNPYDRHAVRVDVLGTGRPETVGYLPRDVAPEYQDALRSLGPRRYATCAARITGGGAKYYGIYLHVAEPGNLSLAAPTTCAVTLMPETTCTVTGEEKHQRQLRHLLGVRETAQVVAQLGWCTIAAGKYAGRTAIEVRVSGTRVGQLTYAMTCRYADLVRAAERNGKGPQAEALLADGPRGVQVELRMPRVPAAW